MAATSSTDLPAGNARNGRGSSARREMIQTAIYEQAERLFAERGYAGTNPQDIADAVGISRQSLYYYVKSKEEILATLVSEMTTNVVTEMRGIISKSDNPTESLYQVAHYLVTDRAKNRTRFRLLDRSESALPDDLAQAYLDGRRQALNLLISVIDDGIRQGHFRSQDARVAALTVLGMCNWVAWWFEIRAENPIDPIAQQIADAAVRVVAVDAGAGAPPADASGVLDAIDQQLARLRLLVDDNTT